MRTPFILIGTVSHLSRCVCKDLNSQPILLVLLVPPCGTVLLFRPCWLCFVLPFTPALHCYTLHTCTCVQVISSLVAACPLISVHVVSLISCLSVLLVEKNIVESCSL